MIREVFRYICASVDLRRRSSRYRPHLDFRASFSGAIAGFDYNMPTPLLMKYDELVTAPSVFFG